MTHEEASALRDQAALLADSTRREIDRAMTRDEHIRLSILAGEADRLVQAFDILLATV